MSVTVLSPADASAKCLDYLAVAMTSGDISFWRGVCPVGDTTLDEIIAAMKGDYDFGNPLVESGQLTAMRDGKCILLARYSLGGCDGPYDNAEIEEVTAYYNNETSEVVAV